MSKELLKLLEFMKYDSWKYIMTLDEAWFYLSPDHELIWLSREDEAPQRERKIVSSPKMMPSVVWNRHGFPFIGLLPNRSKFNAGHHISRILSPLPEIFAACQDGPRRHLVIDAESARSHRAKKIPQFLDHNSMGGGHHPLYSPELTSSDF
jgi:hypothetical protein